MKKIKLGLLPKLFIAIAIGIVVGWVSPDWMIRVTNSFRDTFGQFIKFIVPFIILGLVAPAIIDTGKNAGRMLLLTIGLAWVSTVIFGYFAYGVSAVVFPKIVTGVLGDTSSVKAFPAFFVLQIPPIMDVITALVTSLIIGFGAIVTGAEILSKGADELRKVVMLTLKYAFVPFLPAYILTVMADLTASGKLAAVGGTGVKIMIVAIATTTAVLVIQYCIAGAIAGKNPLKALWTMLPAYLTGWGCCSSAATIPYTLAQTKKNGVSDETASLVIPLCSSMHMAGSMANVVVYSAGLLILMGQGLPFGAYTEYIFLVSLVAVASPGVPGGIVLATQAVAETALGFTPERYAIMIAIYLALDGMGTACNLTGDGAIAMIVDRFKKGRCKGTVIDG